MRIGLISDIHGNLVALETVLHELEQEHTDQVICLGDVGTFGPQPHEVIERLSELKCHAILGNTDAWLLTPPVALQTDSEDRRAVYEINARCAKQLSPEDRGYVQTFASTLTFPLDEGRTLMCYHGSPRSFDDVIAATTPDVEVTQMLEGYTATIFVGGHTHIQMLRRHEDAHLVNVGSVGLPGVNPMNHHLHWAEYGVLTVEDGRLSIDLHRTPLDMAALLEAGTNSDMPHIELWTQKWERT